MAEQPDWRPEDEDNFGVGQMADGTIAVIAPDDFARSLAQRQAEEAAFADLLGDDVGLNPDDLEGLDIPGDKMDEADTAVA